MAKITLENLAHSYSAHPKGPEDYALKELNHDWQDGAAYALLGVQRLREIDAAEHHLGAADPVAGAHPVRRGGRDPRAHGGTQHRAGVPVSGRLRHHDRARQPGLSPEEPRPPRGLCGRARGPDRRDDRDGAHAGPQGPRPDGGCETEDQPGPRHGPEGRERPAVRRAADRDRPAHEMGAAHPAEEAASRFRPHDDLCDP